MKVQHHRNTPEVVKWWRHISGETINKSKNPVAADRGALAELRRISRPEDALLCSHAIELVRSTGAKHWEHQVRVASLAAIISHIRKDDPSFYVATRLGGADKDERLMKSIRFQRLMKSEPGDERFTAFRRAIKMLKGQASVADVADAWLSWDDDVRGEAIRIAWMFRYVGLGNKEMQVQDSSESEVHNEPVHQEVEK